MKSVISIALAVLLTLFVAGIAGAADQWYAPRDAGPSISYTPETPFIGESNTNSKVATMASDRLLAEGPSISFTPERPFLGEGFASRDNVMLAVDFGYRYDGPSISYTPEHTFTGAHYFFSGKVVALGSDMKTLKVEAVNSEERANPMLQTKLSLSADNMTNIEKCDMSGNLEDLKVGEDISVKYHPTYDGLIADGIKISC